jgi:DNA-binding NtrC family response regulator
MRVLVVEDDGGLRRGLLRHLRRSCSFVAEAGSVADAVAALRVTGPVDALLVDLRLPDGLGLDILAQLPTGAARPAAIVMTGEASVESAVGALRVGALDYILKPFSTDAVDAALARVIARPDTVAPRPPDLVAAAGWRDEFAPRLLGRSPALLAAIDILRRVAATHSCVVVEGETGTGKELAARGLHAASRRRSGPFIAVNCAAVPEALVESELFGHAKGAFTGAQTSRAGRFTAAEGGTLFLDEVGEMPLSIQAKLLRALQEGEVTPVGEDEAHGVDVRVIAATHRDLELLVAAQKFREDLLYRLDVVRVRLPPLRERREDVEELVAAFVESASLRADLAVTGADPEVIRVLGAHPWPGNVRQLAHVIERMVLFRGQGRLTLADVPAAILRHPTIEDRAAMGQPAPVLPERGLDLRLALERFEGSLLEQALRRTGGNRNRAAALLGLNRTTLVEKLRKRRQDPNLLVLGEDDEPSEP